jgi:hypothetical protein
MKVQAACGPKTAFSGGEPTYNVAVLAMQVGKVGLPANDFNFNAAMLGGYFQHTVLAQKIQIARRD